MRSERGEADKQRSSKRNEGFFQGNMNQESRFPSGVRTGYGLW